jgi:hypothetical protein
MCDKPWCHQCSAVAWMCAPSFANHGVEAGGHTQDHSQGFEQEWVQVVPGGQEEPSHSQAAAAKKGVGEAIHSQELKLVDPEHAPDF